MTAINRPLSREMPALNAVTIARKTWPSARLATARKTHRCDWQTGEGLCTSWIKSGDIYVDPGDSNPDRVGGFGGYRYCLMHFVPKAEESA